MKNMVIWGLSIFLLFLLPGSLSGKRLNSCSKSWPLSGFNCMLPFTVLRPTGTLWWGSWPVLPHAAAGSSPAWPVKGLFINCRHYKPLCSLALQTHPYYDPCTDPRLMEGATILWKLQSTVIRVITQPQSAENRLHSLNILVVFS